MRRVRWRRQAGRGEPNDPDGLDDKHEVFVRRRGPNLNDAKRSFRIERDRVARCPVRYGRVKLRRVGGRPVLELHAVPNALAEYPNDR